MVYARGEGIVLNEPSVIALNSRNGEVLAMGHEAWQMIGRTPSYIVAVRPLRKGANTDFDVTQRMIRVMEAMANSDNKVFFISDAVMTDPAAMIGIKTQGMGEINAPSNSSDDDNTNDNGGGPMDNGNDNSDPMNTNDNGS